MYFRKRGHYIIDRCNRISIFNTLHLKSFVLYKRHSELRIFNYNRNDNRRIIYNLKTQARFYVRFRIHSMDSRLILAYYKYTIHNC